MGINETIVNDVVYFLKDTFHGRIQMFDVPNWTGDVTSTIYSRNGVTIEWSEYYGYVEIFGLTKEEFHAVQKSCGE